MNSESENIARPSAEERHERGMKELRDKIAARKAEIEVMYEKACTYGLIVNRDKIARNYPWFYRWYTGQIATGYLMRRTGIKRITTPGKP